MARTFVWTTLATCLIVAAGVGDQSRAGAQYQYNNNYPSYQLNRFYYYPYHYFPHNYWPNMGPKWPEAPGSPYMRPPAYMAYPPFKEPHWRYEYFSPQTYHRGFHFMLDQF